MPQAEPVFLKIVITRDVMRKIETFKNNWKGSDVTEVLVRLEGKDGHAYEIGGDMIEFLKRVGLGEVVSEIE